MISVLCSISILLSGCGLKKHTGWNDLITKPKNVELHGLSINPDSKNFLASLLYQAESIISPWSEGATHHSLFANDGDVQMSLAFCKATQLQFLRSWWSTRTTKGSLAIHVTKLQAQGFSNFGSLIIDQTFEVAHLVHLRPAVQSNNNPDL